MHLRYAKNGTWSKYSKEKAELFAVYHAFTIHPYPRQTADEHVREIRKKNDKIRRNLS